MAARDTVFLLTLGLACFASSLGARVTDPMVPSIAAEFAAPVTTVALLSTSYALPYGLCQPILGPLGDTFGKSAVLKVCVALMALMIGLGAVAGSLNLLFASRVAAGIAAGGVIPLALAMLGDRFALDRRQIAIGRLMAVTLIGQIAGVTTAGVLADAAGWRVAIGVTAGIAGAAALGTVLLLPRNGPETRPRFDLGTTFGRYGIIFRNPRAYICYGGVFAEGLSIYGVLPYIAEMLRSQGAGGPSEAGFIIAGIGVGGILFSVLAGRILGAIGPFGAMRLGGVLVGLGLAGFGFAANWRVGMACFTAIGLGFFMLHSTLQNRATELAPSARGSAVALHAFFFFSGQAIAPALFGPAYHRFGAAASLFACALAMAATGLIAAWLLHGVDRREAERAV